MHASLSRAAPARALLPDHTATVLAHPSFDTALRLFCTGLADVHAQAPFKEAGLAKTIRWVIAGSLIHLDHIAPASIRATTLSQLCVDGRLGTRNTVSATLAQFRRAGLVADTGSAGDLRVPAIRPTPQLHDMVAQSLTARLRGVAMVHALPLSPDAWAAQPSVLQNFVAGMVSAYVAEDFRPYGAFPEAQSMIEHQSGYAILLAIMAGVLRYRDHVTVKLSMAEIALRFAVSRAHVSKLIGIGIAAGWLAQGNRLGYLTIAPETHDRLRRWIATEIAWTAQLTGCEIVAPEAKSPGDAVVAAGLKYWAHNDAGRNNPQRMHATY